MTFKGWFEILCFTVSNIQTLQEIFVSLQFLINSSSQICQFCRHLLNKIAQKLSWQI